MPIKILMPALSPTMLEGNLIKWLKNENDYIKAGDILAEIETDKATMEIEVVDEGILGKILVQEGTNQVLVNSVIAIVLQEGETKDDLDQFLNKINDSNQSDTNTNVPKDNIKSDNKLDKISTSSSHNLTDNSRIFASPIAKKIATTQNIDLAKIVGSGPQGRIIKSDVEENKITQHSIVNENNGDFYLKPNNNIRKIIAKRLQESKQTIPHFYLSIECNIDKLLDIREDINKNFELKEQKISINDFIVLAVAKSLLEVKDANASWEEHSIKYYNNIDISIAVATDHGLMTPIIKNADQKDIIMISKEIKELAQKARANKLRLDEFQGGGFSISNLGMYGIKNFTAIINPPQSCILAIGAAEKRPIIVNDQIKIANIMDLTLSCDHRVVDGIVGAKFLSVIKKYIDFPAMLLI